MNAVLDASIEDLIQELATREQRKGKIYDLFPADGPFGRDQYPQHMRFFGEGARRSSRLAMCANGVGKTFSMGGYETALHLTGLYPDWWPGHRYDRPVRWWVAGKTKETTRDNQQKVLLGEVNAEEEGGGLIPAENLDFGSIRRRSQGGGAIDYMRIQHVSGGWSRLAFKSYDQKLDAFFGENLDGGWMDEPAPVLIYSEIMARFRGSPHPCMMVTFTPKSIKAEQAKLIELFTEDDDPSRIVIQCGWDDVPHLTEQFKSDLLANTPVWMRDTVSKGVIALGAGAVYPVPEERFVIDSLPEIPEHWRRIAGFDGGWHNTAVGWHAWDKDSDIVYLYSEHKAGELAVPLHAAAIKARGDWIPIIGDAGARDQNDGKKCRDEYKKEGVLIKPADKAIDAGVQSVLTRILTGRFKVVSTCTEWLKEYRLYHYDEKTGEIVKTNDHLMDQTRYAIHGGLKYAKSALEAAATNKPEYVAETRFGRRY